MVEVICLMCGWKGNTDYLNGKCGQFPEEHDARYLWNPPSPITVQKYTKQLCDRFGSLQEFVTRLSCSLPPCSMAGLPLGEIHDEIVKLTGDTESALHIMDILILRGYLGCPMFGKDSKDWRNFRMMFVIKPNSMNTLFNK